MAIILIVDTFYDVGIELGGRFLVSRLPSNDKSDAARTRLILQQDSAQFNSFLQLTRREFSKAHTSTNPFPIIFQQSQLLVNGSCPWMTSRGNFVFDWPIVSSPNLPCKIFFRIQDPENHMNIFQRKLFSLSKKPSSRPVLHILKKISSNHIYNFRRRR